MHLPQQQQQPPIRCLTILTIISTVFALGIAATIAAVRNYGIGLEYQATVLCTTYHTGKFSSLKQQYTASTAGALLSVILLPIAMISNIRKWCCHSSIDPNSQSPQQLWREGQATKFYLLYSLALIGITVTLGTYLSILIQKWISCLHEVETESLLLSIAGLIQFACTLLCWIIALRQCYKQEELQKMFVETSSHEEQANNGYEKEVQEFYSTVKKMDETNMREKLLFQNTPIPLVQQTLPESEDPSAKKQSIRAALKKEALMTLKKEKKKQEIQMKKMRFRELNSLSRTEIKAKREAKNENERQDDFRLQGMDKTFGQLMQDAKRPKRMPQPTTLLLNDSPKGNPILSVFATSLPKELAPDEAKRERLNKRAMEQVAFMARSKLKSEDVNQSEKSVVSFKENVNAVEKKQIDNAAPNLFSNLFGLKSTDKIEQPHQSIDEKGNERQLGQSRNIHDSPITAKFEPASELLSHAQLEQHENLGSIQQRPMQASATGESEELYYFRPKLGHGNADRKKKQLFDNDIIQPQAFDLEGHEVTIVNKIRGNRTITVGKKGVPNSRPEAATTSTKKQKAKVKSRDQLLMASLRNKYRQPQSPKRQNPFAALLMQ